MSKTSKNRKIKYPTNLAGYYCYLKSKIIIDTNKNI